jgi:hypothetical protein
MTDRKHINDEVQPYSSSLEDFCRFLDVYGQQVSSPQDIVSLWESQAEALRIRREDASVEAIDMLLDTMLTTLQHLAEAQEQKRWTNRLWSLGRQSQTSSPPSFLLQQT